MKFTKHILGNGMRVLFAPRNETDAVTVLVMTKVGSRYESAANNGVSHFLEHMMFKGTEKRPTALDVSKELDGIGASFNAFTSKDFTGYYIKASQEHLPLALDIIADMLLHSKFAKEEVERERTVIVEEINMYEDNPIMHLGDVFEETMFGKQHPLGRFIAGPKKVIRGMTREMITSYFHRHYFPANMVFAVAGRFHEQRTLRLLEKMFGSVTHRQKPMAFRRFSATQAKPKVAVHFRKTEQVQLGLGYLGLPYKHKDLPALRLLTVILGGNMSSRLFSTVRERNGLAYAIQASVDQYEETGVFCVQAGVDRSRIEPAISLILQELQKVKRDGVTAKELAHAKEFIRGKLILGLEDSEEVANFLAKQELLTDSIQTPEERFAALRKVQRKDLQRVARSLFRPSRMTLALIGPFRSPAPFRKLVGG